MLTHNIRSLHSIKFLHTLRSVKSCQFSGFLPSISLPPVAEEWPNIYLQYLFCDKIPSLYFLIWASGDWKIHFVKGKILIWRHINIKSLKIYEDHQGHTWGNSSCWEAVGLTYRYIFWGVFYMARFFVCMVFICSIWLPSGGLVLSDGHVYALLWPLSVTAVCLHYNESSR